MILFGTSLNNFIVNANVVKGPRQTNVISLGFLHTISCNPMAAGTSFTIEISGSESWCRSAKPSVPWNSDMGSEGKSNGCSAPLYMGI